MPLIMLGHLPSPNSYHVHCTTSAARRTANLARPPHGTAGQRRLTLQRLVQKVSQARPAAADRIHFASMTKFNLR